ncbi:fumarylacetoacetate (FAA) hydrolase [Thalassobacillus pellis]|nr:fumarylacetoacetate (FAA) hydrolase [Thalassobacillus pellis]
MKFITFKKTDGSTKAGWMENGLAVDMEELSDGKLPGDLLTFLKSHQDYYSQIETLRKDIHLSAKGVYPLEEIELRAPIPCPVSVRDFYAFEDHVKTARGKRGLEVVPEWYQIPVFYFTNHLAIKGPGDTIKKPEKCDWLDYELEIACVIGKQGRNVTKEQAEDHIFGYCIMNDWSARDIQKQEMKVGLGPAKGKDFATSIGPWLVTKDELTSYRRKDRYNLEMVAEVNGKLLSRGNLLDIHYSFAEMIERASEEVTLYPGEIIGSGTVGTGCILELGTEVHRWLKPGDEVELSITGLGKLSNRII